MKFFYILDGKKIKKWLLIISIAFVTASIFYIQQLTNESVFSSDPGPKAIYKVENKKNELALTFDISWGETNALTVLNVLKKHGVKATFFLSASWAERHPRIVNKIVEDGHEIGSMGYEYKNYTELERGKIIRDLAQAKKVFDTLGIKHIPFLRVPTGNFNKNVLKVVHSFGHTVVHWSVDSKDWLSPGVHAIVENVTKNAKSGDIVLLHASDSAKQTASALEQIIVWMKKEGYRSVTISDLVNNAHIKSKEIK
ncbi:polysaccharide deacetylase family sporulation protein PdaB [Anoxybacillus sp. D401a]|uniref:polysaccharide deacetylase family sporulation protein PdaB n=1 Tax=Anoxybacillus sp. D401a TaxID=575112 RepID=UPI003D3285BA